MTCWQYTFTPTVSAHSWCLIPRSLHFLISESCTSVLSCCREMQLEVTSSAICWRSHVWSIRTTVREISTSSTSCWREETMTCWDNWASRETHSTTTTCYRSNTFRSVDYRDLEWDVLTWGHISDICITAALLQGECAKVSSINDRNDWKSVKNALSVMHFDLSDIEVKTWTL